MQLQGPSLPSQAARELGSELDPEVARSQIGRLIRSMSRRLDPSDPDAKAFAKE